jgi:hypothetical protein
LMMVISFSGYSALATPAKNTMFAAIKKQIAINNLRFLIVLPPFVVWSRVYRKR